VSVVEKAEHKSQLLNAVTFCVLDLETTGASAAYGGITEIGAVKYCGGEEVGRFSTLVNPGQPIPAPIVILTGITNSMVSGAPRIEELLDLLLEFIGDSVLVAHNARFDVGFINAALARYGYEPLANVVVDTVTLARRLVRNEVPNCKLSTLASCLGLRHQPVHRAMDDVLATGDLLHYLIERAASFGVSDLEDLIALPKMGSHPEADKLQMTNDLPRAPGVYMFVDAMGDVLYVGKATNIRTRVRSYFGVNESRKKVGSLLKLTHGIHYIEAPDAVTAEVWELRIIGRLRPRYNHVGTRTEKYCYVRLTTDEEWPRLVVTKVRSSSGLYLGPITSRSMAREVIDAIEAVVPLRRCTVRMGRNYVAPTDAPTCSAARLGLAYCPCSGSADASVYAEIVQLVSDTMTQESTQVQERLSAKMGEHSEQHRFEEAAVVRDRINTLNTILHRQAQADALRAEGDFRVQVGDVEYHISSGILQATSQNGAVFAPLTKRSGTQKRAVVQPVVKADLDALIAAPVVVDDGGSVTSSDVLDELMCIARLMETIEQ
jgi:DNA polymerase-3 subunit epsilon